MSALHDLAAAAGLQVDWTDAGGQAKRVSDEALADVLAALGYAADDDTSLDRLRAEQADGAAAIGWPCSPETNAAAPPACSARSRSSDVSSSAA